MPNTGQLQQCLRYTSLNILGMLGISCYILADTFFIAQGTGNNGVTALNLAIPVYSLIHGSGLMLGMGGATKYSIFRGQKNDEQANRIFSHTLWIGAVLAILFVSMGIFFPNQIARLLGANQQVLDWTSSYLQVLLLFSPMFLLNDIMLCFVRNDGQPRLAMTAMIVGSLSNVVLDYVFVFPFHMGIFGAAVATGISPIVSTAILSTYLLRKRQNFHLSADRFSLSSLKTVTSLGFPSMVTEVSSGIVILIFNAILLNLEGNAGVSAYGVITNLSLVAISMFTGAAQGIQPILSRSFGERRPEGVRFALRFGLLLVFGLSVLIFILVFCFAFPISSVFNRDHDPRLYEIAVPGLRTYFIGCLFAGLNIVLSVYFTSIERPASAHWISLCRGLFAIIPISLLLSWKFGVAGLWSAFPVTEFLVCLFGFLWYLRVQKRQKNGFFPADKNTLEISD